MSGVTSTIDEAVNWIATNARLFSYLLPDMLELALSLVIVAYFVLQLAQQRA